MAKIETIRVVDKTDRGFKTINKCDFDKNIHREFTEAIAKQAEKLEKDIAKVDEAAEKKKETTIKGFFDNVVGSNDSDRS